MDQTTKTRALELLRDIETAIKRIEDLKHSDESEAMREYHLMHECELIACMTQEVKDLL